MKRIIETDDAPAAVGAYSQAAGNDSLLFTAGQIPMTADGNLLDDDPIENQTEQALYNLDAVLDEAGASAEDILKVSVFLEDINDFDAMNEAYADYFDDQPPARSAVEVSALPKGVAVEIEAIASLEDEA
ncbi:Rid family detoxifying hydrolase [Natrinema versiforme]|uniref:Endoribonuclease L-PSP n=1 Tax=Natrinema versiforme JCM 10478 TaxID=1227496 RepID=L9Y2Z0_9EURY|nr:Rid family detoxifying hydrolase [Natrinema versiforme]ELY68067.1 endoribonuclease L-PSP [Natrinema versiforme JCM 10478]